MPSEDYKPAARGALKIKGVQSSKVDKHKKKKKKKDSTSKTDETTVSTDAEQSEKTIADALADEDEKDKQVTGSGSGYGSAMTEAEKQSYERRYKMLEDRLKKEGVKSHKERVESLNRYLSTLSEHHDMPRIGPG